MARPASSGKRENEKKKQSKRLEKQKRKEDRKSNNAKGASLEEMFAYVDENGMITSTPPEERKKEVINPEDIQISTPKKIESEEDSILKGRVDRFIESKGYGFIKELDGGRSFFFHVSSAPENIREGNIVFFEVEGNQRDTKAINIRFEA